jgi:hypothetical protein
VLPNCFANRQLMIALELSLPAEVTSAFTASMHHRTFHPNRSLYSLRVSGWLSIDRKSDTGLSELIAAHRIAVAAEDRKAP